VPVVARDANGGRRDVTRPLPEVLSEADADPAAGGVLRAGLRGLPVHVERVVLGHVLRLRDRRKCHMRPLEQGLRGGEGPPCRFGVAYAACTALVVAEPAAIDPPALVAVTTTRIR